MTDREIMQQALEALQSVLPELESVGPLDKFERALAAIITLRERLAQPEQDAVLAEREACAKVCDDLDAMNWTDFGEYKSGYSEAIRARGKDSMPLFDDWGMK